MRLSNVEVEVEFVPSMLRAFARNEVQMNITLKNSVGETYWSECDVMVATPLSLAHDSELVTGRTRMGLLKPLGTISKHVNLYTRPNNYPDDYKLSVIAYIYDGEGAIFERLEKKISLACIAEEKPLQDKKN